ncbi:MAG TPA: lytic murein transglycosylase, partial [Burkholderiaceae bacterium]
MCSLHTTPSFPLLRAALPAVLLALAGCASTPPTAPASSATTPLAPPPAMVNQPATTPEPAAFDAWVQGFARDAVAAGIRPATVQTALAHAQFLPRAVELDRAQPEFTRTPWAYLDSAVSPQRIAQGQDKLRDFQPQMDAASARYGVPAAIITAIWGMESNYGTNFGSFSTIDALATLAFDGRRRDWARGELLAALRILDNGDIDPAHMVGSWAGAMGNTQFLPSAYLAYAVDADGDGRRDIWGSMADVAA